MRIAFFNSLGRATAEFMGMAIICMAICLGAYLVINPQARIFGIAILDKPLSLSSLMALVDGVSRFAISP